MSDEITRHTFIKRTRTTRIVCVAPHGRSLFGAKYYGIFLYLTDNRHRIKTRECKRLAWRPQQQGEARENVVRDGRGWNEEEGALE